jgi:preprotein translocase subunit SecF
MTYSGMVNLSMNQTLARSLNTSLVAVIPVMSVLFVGAELLGATTLREYGLALFIGLMSGAYSSIFIASPLLALLKEREPRMKELKVRLESKSPRQAASPAEAARLAGPNAGRPSGENVIQPKARKQKRR